MRSGGPLKRRTPLRSTKPLRSLTGLSRAPFVRRQSERARRYADELDQITETLLRRSDGYCEFIGCRRRQKLHRHHIVRRSQGGGNEATNLVMLCPAHHEWVHSCPERASKLGLLKRRPLS